MPSYKTHDPRGWGGDPSRGAALGRPTVIDGSPSGRLYLRKVPLDAGGYDPNGTYFGACIHGVPPLYWYADAGGNIDAVLRANDRDDAKRQIRERIPGARFWR